MPNTNINNHYPHAHSRAAGCFRSDRQAMSESRDTTRRARLREAAAKLARLAREPGTYQVPAAGLYAGRTPIGVLRDPTEIGEAAATEALARLPFRVRLMCGLEGEDPVTATHLTDIDMLLAGEPGDPVPSLNALRAREAVGALTALRRIAIARDSAVIARLANYALYFLLSRFGAEGDLVRMAVIRITTTTEAQGSGHLRPGEWTLPARARQIALARLRLLAAVRVWTGIGPDMPVSTVANLIGGCLREFPGPIETAHADLLAELAYSVAAKNGRIEPLDGFANTRAEQLDRAVWIAQRAETVETAAERDAAAADGVTGDVDAGHAGSAAEVDIGSRPGIPSDMAEKMKALERENRELRQANEILRKASAYFAMAELDRPLKR